ncbi:ABC transporter permease [Pseudomonas vlassakiae]|uniref:ABC transporter permease n=1 Tax=Pseudomonas vlassakiae TaxID=485888 RepID=A0A923K7M6_9PSED|nr:ABC transporter permease [Pseudomonas vlassakiae]MBV4542797.1 ABC transporter permease [Pseudomonas vlassakiae]
MKKVVFFLVALATIIFLIGPLLAILPLAFTSNVFLTYPIGELSLRWFDVVFNNDVWHRSMVNSLIMGVGSTFLATVLGTLAALGLRNKNVPCVSLLKTVFLLPMVVPAVVLGVGMQIVFAKLGLASSYTGVIIAHTVLALPFVLISVLDSLAGIHSSLERAAASLGAKPFATFRHVVLPLAAPGIGTGAVFAFATSLDEVVITLFLAGPNQTTMALKMFSSLRENVTPAVTAVAFILILITLVLIGAAALMKRRSNHEVSN